ncbi:leishmanolysin-like peptidase [Cimex lectularius]|uniref:Leishmanolysin-like peptidase n=1 Tax=Cimex lectularius TaxID=79782 RepID=A0A8I6RS98_CIMLE|nr:leishmanolysin-like peptidase [Cimex lectularius]
MGLAPCQIWDCDPWASVILLLLVSHSVLPALTDSKCNHVHPKLDEVIHDVHIEPAHIMKKRSIDQPLRVFLYCDESVYKLEKEKFLLINNTILPKAVRFWEMALMVRKTEKVIRLNRKCVNNQVFYHKKEPYSYCKNACENKTLCGEVTVPEEHLDVCRTCNASGLSCMEHGTPGKGITGADFVFYVSAMPTERCKKGLTVAYAAHCQQEAVLDRPIAGHGNFCPNSISTNPQELDILLSTVKHEILHALGFSISLFAFFRDAEGNPLTPREENGKPMQNTKLQARQWSDKVIKTVNLKEWNIHGGAIERQVQMMVTPRVVKEVREHFNCSTLEGAELEDQGGEGTVLTHWEKRVFENEAMTGTHTQNPVYSMLTLALMEDTGWYMANYSMAQPLRWGKNLGCDFVTKSCKHWIDTKREEGISIHPFCDKVKADPLKTECTSDRTSVALCNLVQYEKELPPNYQNFDFIPNVTKGREGYYGGVVSLADYCPYIQEFSWRAQNIVVRGSRCQYPENNPHPDKNFALEEYGEDSRCFDHTNEMWEEKSCKQSKQWQYWGSGCYRFTCDEGLLQIIVHNVTYTCYYSGQTINVQLIVNGSLHKGAIVCPPCQELCNSTCITPGKIIERPVETKHQLICGSPSLMLSWIIILLSLAIYII